MDSRRLIETLVAARCCVGGDAVCPVIAVSEARYRPSNVALPERAYGAAMSEPPSPAIEQHVGTLALLALRELPEPGWNPAVVGACLRVVLDWLHDTGQHDEAAWLRALSVTSPHTMADSATVADLCGRGARRCQAWTRQPCAGAVTERPTVAERAEADGWQRVAMRLVEPGDRVRLHARSPEWTGLDVVRPRRGRDRTWRVTGYGDDGQWWDIHRSPRQQDRRANGVAVTVAARSAEEAAGRRVSGNG